VGGVFRKKKMHAYWGWPLPETTRLRQQKLVRASRWTMRRLGSATSGTGALETPEKGGANADVKNKRKKEGGGGFEMRQPSASYR